MTIPRTKPGDWSLGEKMTSAQANSLDTSITYAADKRTGQTENIGAVWAFTGAGRAVTTSIVGANANTSYDVGDAAVIVVDSTVNADRVYTLVDTGAQDRKSVV